MMDLEGVFPVTIVTGYGLIESIDATLVSSGGTITDEVVDPPPG